MKQVKKKEIWYIVGILLTVVAGAVLFFFPDLIENKYPYTYQNVQEKDSQVQGLNSELLSNESNILAAINQLKELEEEKKIIERDAMEVRSGINEDDFILDIPSILIDLEQNAILNNVVLEIGYGSITHIKADENIISETNDNNEDIEPEEGSENESEDEENKEENSDEEQNKEESSEESESEGTSDESANNVEITKAEGDEEDNGVSEEFIRDNASSIEGIDTTVIPIFIKGSYQDVRNYIKYLDKIGMIEPSSVNLTSVGKEIEGTVLLNVFHGEVGL